MTMTTPQKLLLSAMAVAALYIAASFRDGLREYRDELREYRETEPERVRPSQTPQIKPPKDNKAFADKVRDLMADMDITDDGEIRE